MGLVCSRNPNQTLRTKPFYFKCKCHTVMRKHRRGEAQGVCVCVGGVIGKLGGG